MKAQYSLLSLAIASTLALVPAQADAARDAKSAAITRANLLVNGTAATAVRRASGDAFVARGASMGAKGTEHVRYQRTYKGLPVIGGDFIVHSRNGKLAGVTQTLKTSARPSLSARISGDQAIVEAGAHFGSRFVGAPTARQVVFARGGITPKLAHEVVFNGIKADQTPTEMHFFVDARTGKILDKWDAVETARPGPGGGGGNNSCTEAVGTGKSLTEGNVTVDSSKCGNTYRMVDMTRGGGATHNMAMKTAGMGSVYTDIDNAWGTGLLSNSQTVAVDAHYGVSMTWDYYLNVHDRNGIDGEGTGAISRVHYGRNYANAFWRDSCYCMTFGDGDNGATILPLVALDVAGHEMSHGVTSRSAELLYSGDAGGLNEATSDIFGTMVEYYIDNPNDPGDYVIGEKLFKNNADMSKAIRWMFKPSLDGASYDCYESAVSSDDPHYSSGVGNHFYYLLAEGAVVPEGFGAGTWANLSTSDMVCNGNTSLAGIGRDKAERIWYVALTDYMVEDTDYPGARAATVSAATDLYGAGSAEVQAVEAAWDAVSVAAPI